jgi:hypothetical protein
MVFGSHLRVIGTVSLMAVALSVVAVVTVRAHTPALAAFDVPKAKHALALEVLTSDERGRVTLRFTLPRAGIVRIMLATLDGREMGALASGLSSAGENRLDIDVSTIPPGQYRCTLQSRDGTATTRLVIVR